MIASLRGTVQTLGASDAVIDVGGVGYLVQASGRTLSGLRPDTPVLLLVETQVREESITLFGFATPSEREWFRLLIGVQGVGGKVALAILGTLGPDDLARAITLEDKAGIARANGVGPRLAARIVIELKGKVASPAIGPIGTPFTPPAPQTPAADALSALANLGYRPAEAARAVAEAQRDLGDDLPTNTLIREALRRAAK